MSPSRLRRASRIAPPTERSMSVTFGIDFGTSNSAIAIARDREVRVLEWPLPDALAADRPSKLSDTVPTVLFAPVAAALAYEAQLAKDEIVLVADLGGGTSDFTLMRVGPTHQGKADRGDSILSSGGLPVAGDCLDGEVVRSRLFDAFGFGSSY